SRKMGANGTLPHRMGTCPSRSRRDTAAKICSVSPNPPQPRIRDIMQRSTDRILTTHVGSLIRPPELQEFLRAKQQRKPVDEQAYAACLRQTVAEVVRQQADVGVDVISDGEFGKSISWSQYALERLSGFERRPVKPGANPFQRGADRTRFAEFYAELD